MRAILLFVFLLLPLQLSLAHGSGTSFEKEINGLLVDIGYEPEIAQAGEQVLFDFGLRSKTDDAETSFDSVWIRIEQGGRTLIASGVAQPPLGPATLLVALPSASVESLTVYTRFEKDGKALAEASFSLPVLGSLQENTPAPFQDSLPLLLGAILGVVVGFIFGRKTL